MSPFNTTPMTTLEKRQTKKDMVTHIITVIKPASWSRDVLWPCCGSVAGVWMWRPGFDPRPVCMVL